MSDWRSMFDRDFIGAWDLSGRDAVVVIASVEAQTLVSQGNKKNKKPVLHFRGKEKGLALNKTNAKTVAALYGNDTSNWIGKAITLYATTTTFGHETIDCIRIRATAPAAAKSSAATKQQQPAHDPETGEVPADQEPPQ